MLIHERELYEALLRRGQRRTRLAVHTLGSVLLLWLSFLDMGIRLSTWSTLGPVLLLGLVLAHAVWLYRREQREGNLREHLQYLQWELAANAGEKAKHHAEAARSLQRLPQDGEWLDLDDAEDPATYYAGH